MKSTLEPLEGNKVKLSIPVPEAEFEKHIDAAYRQIAREVRLPGFRPGKAPRRLLETKPEVAEAARAEALDIAIRSEYETALDDHQLDVIAAPEVDVVAGREGGDVEYEVIVEVRPEVQVGGYDSLRVTIDSPVATDEEVDERIERLRQNFSTLETVERPAQTGDHVTIDVAGSQDGEPVEGLTADDYLYEVGTGTIVPEFDEQLAGAKVGDVLEFTAEHPQPDEEPVTFKLLVKEVKEKVLPDVDDAFAEEASEFATIDELRADLTKRLSMVKRVQAQMQIQQKTAEALADLVEDDVAPEALVNQEMQQRLEDLAMRLQAQGIGLDQYLASTGQPQEEFVEELRTAAAQGVKVDLALRAVANAEELEVSDEELEAEILSVAERVNQKPAQVRKQLERNGQMPAVRSDLRTRKALEWLVEHVELVDEGGSVIDRASLELEPEPTEDDGTDDPGSDATEDDE